MKYSRKSYRRKRTYRRRKALRRRGKGKKFAAKMLGGGRQMISKAFTQVFALTQPSPSQPGLSVPYYTGCISLIQGELVPTPLGVQGFNVQEVQSDMQQTFSTLYEQHQITGVAAKLIFPSMATSQVQATSWYMGYNEKGPFGQSSDPMKVVNYIMSCSGAQGGAIPQSNSIRRYWKTTGILKRLGVNWSSTGDPDWTYYGQLSQTSAYPVINFAVLMSQALATGEVLDLTLELTYYVKFRQAKNPNVA